jgi:hypothetical protein
MRQVHGPAEKLFVDFAGDTVPVFDAATGVQRLAHVFVAVLGASNYTFAEARWSGVRFQQVWHQDAGKNSRGRFSEKVPASAQSGWKLLGETVA